MTISSRVSLFVASSLLVPGALGVSSYLLAPTAAHACGGTFCDSGPQAMPVDQTGETILFVMGEDFVEAHIRIEYDSEADAAKFAWLVPVPVVPEFAVSSEQLFINALAGTVPVYGNMTTIDDCPDGTSGGGSTFISRPDGGATSFECDIWAQDCPRGDKCMPWANDGSRTYNASRCSPVAADPKQPGDTCMVEGSATSGVDDCVMGAMCTNVDPNTLVGTCTAFCSGSEADPLCPGGGVCQIGNEGLTPLCQTACDPMANECPDGQACANNGFGDFACTPVHYQGTVGAFEVTVIGGNNAAEVMAWLGTNGYDQDPEAEPIIAKYIEAGHKFAAFKLTDASATDAIHPIALRFPDSTEACIPLRLTKIAATDDMKVRALFLGENRTVPQNWRHVLPNPLRMDWSATVANYDVVISRAVDEEPAGGHAFVTEYAGPSDIVPTDGISNPAWFPPAFVAIDPTLVVDQLEAQGLMMCANNSCDFIHPLVRGLLNEHMPVPNGVAEGAFYDCLSCYEPQIIWDGTAFAAAMQERIVAPGQHAVDLLSAWPYLTRLFTMISPEEMTFDPFFHQNPDALPLQDIAPTATRRRLCNSDSVWTLPDGREVYQPLGGPWPDFTNAMPYAEIIEMIPAAGEPMTNANNTETINTQLWEYNCGFDWPSPEACGNPDPTDTDGETDGSGTSTTGTSTTTTSSGGTTGGNATGDGAATSTGCACTTVPSNAPAWSWLATLSVLSISRTRRRR